MKLKSYLRGLGLGILITAIIFCILPKEKESLTDEEICARALQLGMVKSDSITLADVQGKKESQADEQEAVKPTIEFDVAQKQEAEGQSQQAETQTQTSETLIPESMEVQELTPLPVTTESTGVSNQELAAEEGAVIQESDNPELVIFTIPEGICSYTTCRLLYEAGLITDIEPLDDYLCDNGYSKSVRAGVYEIPKGISEIEIANIIIGK